MAKCIQYESIVYNFVLRTNIPLILDMLKFFLTNWLHFTKFDCDQNYNDLERRKYIKAQACTVSDDPSYIFLLKKRVHNLQA
jgi:hypothetical protein